MNDNVLHRIRNGMDGFSKGQKRIANYILTDCDKASNMTACRLGQITQVSESTVVRFASQLGYDGYPAMQKALQELVRGKLTSLQRIEASGDQINSGDIAGSVMQQDMDTLRSTIDGIDRTEFDRVVGKLVRAKRIYILGVRSSSFLAGYLNFYFHLIFENVTLVQSAAGEIFDQMLRIGPGFHERNGWELVKQPIDWDAKDMELNSGAIDCIWNGFTMTGREDEYTFSKPYVDNSIVYVVRADSDIQTEADLAGKHVITQAGSSALSALQDESKADVVNSFASLDEIADYNTAFMNLEAGTNDAIAVDIGVAQYQLTTKADKFRMLEEPLSTEQYAIGFKKGNEELRDQVQATLDEMAEDGTLAEIAAKYKDYNLDQMLCLGK